jgi:hypothetical protein
VVSVCKIVAVGQADAEETALQWASEHGIVTCRNTSTAFTWPPRLTGREVSRRTAWLLENVLQSEGSLLLTLNLATGPEQSKAIEFLGASNTERVNDQRFNRGLVRARLVDQDE